MNEFKCTLQSNGIEYDYFVMEMDTEAAALNYAEKRFKVAYPHVEDQSIIIEKYNQS